MTSQRHPHTGHELSRSRAHEGERMQQDHDKGGHQGGHGKAPSPVDIQKTLKGMDYPASKDDVVRCAERSHADGDVIDMLRRIPDRQYDTPASVSKEVGKLM
ncbi:DUF2795 domain-containing protein [Burkholderia oklahomensis]|uniref:DUF2795 domain-containing protein n=1 Tax=Burkholderia oklahomensis TaxID=342113 RepID=UPI00016A97FF|nr:DUF2795 domain-containing protein [Burkholderia oklahomensis]AJX35605.1 hypothetical protein BG90_3953 [Burkholderia oklahomensis C6786]AOI49981.1 hypothetical protein WI23_30265 [Burkholderia oklahomensis C6786]KUY53101.1 hypothetical protein WI23_23185 [Burkholderia oklahomensis C6786]MBI0364144.1 DUF2795 domain-containing protein [Burkholderia oklahomensis]SUY28505.1 Protein of uncharacterised function (DUF2795) [Burkholderia oklahomensis]